MSLFNKIEQKQSLKINISNELVQSLKILNMGRQELEEEISAEAISNPLLEVQIKEDEVDWEKYFRNEEKNFKVDRNEMPYTDSSEYDFENIISDMDSFYDYLHGQVNIMKVDYEMKKICNYLIDSLDEDGYLRDSELDIAKKIGVDKVLVEEGISIVQELDPPGICARNLGECLVIQLHSMDIYDEVLENIVEKNLNLVANANVSEISKKYKIDKEKVKGYILLIKSLDPKPASKYSSTNTVYAYPDVVVEKVDGRYVAKPYKEKNIKLGINKYYKDLLYSSDDENVKKYIREKLNSAKKIINEVSDRSSTVVSISNAIIDIQDDYFNYGGKLKPMTLSDVAEKIGYHMSTVSRGVNDKYMLTPRGLFELRSFFSSGYKTDEGSISSDTIKKEIKNILDNEDKKKPLSDKKIEDILKERGYEVARRTVAKYREELGFLSSSKRKKIL